MNRKTSTESYVPFIRMPICCGLCGWLSCQKLIWLWWNEVHLNSIKTELIKSMSCKYFRIMKRGKNELSRNCSTRPLLAPLIKRISELMRCQRNSSFADFQLAMIIIIFTVAPRKIEFTCIALECFSSMEFSSTIPHPSINNILHIAHRSMEWFWYYKFGPIRKIGMRLGTFHFDFSRNDCIYGTEKFRMQLLCAADFYLYWAYAASNNSYCADGQITDLQSLHFTRTRLPSRYRGRRRRRRRCHGRNERENKYK